jgi:hypothetical protein
MPIIVPEPIFDHSQLIMYSVRSWWPGFFALSLSILALRGASFGVEAHLSDPDSEQAIRQSVVQVSKKLPQSHS